MDREYTNAQIVPMFLTMAEYDLWNPGLEPDGTMLTKALDMWLINNGFATEENVSEVRRTGMTETYTEGRFKNYVWKNKEGVPLFRYAIVAAKDHVNMPMENWLLWNQWFSKWKVVDGVRTYDGKPI